MKIKNWNEFQHFKDRSPPWIKLYRENLYRRDIMSLSDRNFKILICLWMLASEDKDKSGNLPEISDIAFKLRLSESDVSKALQELHGFIDIDDSDLISTVYQHDAPETETEGETYSKEKEKREKQAKARPPSQGISFRNWLEVEKQKDPDVSSSSCPDNLYDEAGKIGFEHTAIDQWEKFHDHWIAQSGQKAIKADWIATWRNWLRRDFNGKK